MKIHLIALFVFGFLSAAISQNVNIPDVTFKTYLLSQDDINTNFDDDIQVSEAMAYTDSIICVGMGITDLTGIEAFQNIRFLSCVNNQLTELNVSQNIALQELICAMNNIYSLDVSSNINLKNLRCSYNPIYTLSVGNNPNLQYLYCENNYLSALDVTQNPGLLELFCTHNSIQSLDLSVHQHLQRLDCSSMPLNHLDLAPSNDLVYIMCNGNSLSEIDLTKCPLLEEFRGVNGYYTQLDLSNCPHLKRFDCPFGHLTSLDFSHNPQMEVIYCFSSELTSLNVANGNNPNLQLLWATGNQLSCVKVDNATYSTQNWTGNNFGFDSLVYFSENCSAGLTEKEQIEIELYPNPATTSVNVTVSGPTNYSITSTDGTVIASGELSAGNHLLNTGSFTAGIYFVEFNVPGKTPTVRKLQKLD